MSDSDRSPVARPDFFKRAAVAGAAAGVASVDAAAAEVEPAGESPDVVPEGDRGYHVTPHIRSYYRLADL